MAEEKLTNKEGYLKKLGFETPNWKKRYFVLEKNVVSYYSADSDFKKKKPAKGTFVLDFLSESKIKPVETGTIVMSSNALADKASKVILKKNFLIQIGDCRWNETGLRTFYVSCETEEERKEWLKALTNNCEMYVNSSEGRQDEAKIPSEGERREAYNLYLEERKKQEEEKRKVDAAQQKKKAMRDEPWYQIHNLCSKGTVEALQEGVAHGADVHLLNPNGGSTLLQAATYGNVPVMKYLISQKIDIDAQSHGGNTALHAAACMGFYEAAKLLLEHGANRFAKNKEGKTAAQAAKTEAIRELVDNWGQEGASGAGAAAPSGAAAEAAPHDS